MLKNFFRQNTSGFGLEIGDAAIKVLELKKIKTHYRLIGRRREELPKNTVLDGEIKNEEILVETIKRACRNALPRSIKSKNVVLSLPENKTFIKIFQIKKENPNRQNKAILLEAEKYLPFSLADMYTDWQIIKSTLNDLIIFFAACPKKIVDSYQRVLVKAGLNPQVFDLEAAAEARALTPQKPNLIISPLVICDVGKTKTLLIICDNQTIYFTKTIYNISGDIFTSTVAKNLNLPESEAEKIKITCCSPKMSEKERKTLKALHLVLDKLAEEIEKICDYFQNQKSGEKIRKILLCGGGAATMGIAKYLALKLRKTVKIGNPWQNIPQDKPFPLTLQESLAFTKTIGLALRATNL